MFLGVTHWTLASKKRGRGTKRGRREGKIVSAFDFYFGDTPCCRW